MPVSPIMRVTPPLFLLMAGLVSGCASQEPFVDVNNASTATTNVTVQKTPSTVLRQGRVYVCHGGNPQWAEVTALAEEQCAVHGLKSVFMVTQRWQCRATAPHRSNFMCVDPEMREADGTYVNPFVPQAVRAWEQRTGKTAPDYHANRGALVSPPAPTTVAPDALPGPAAPPPAPISAAPSALTPAGIAGKPAMPTQPLRMETPPPPPAPADDGFKLPVGSWGEHFQD